MNALWKSVKLHNLIFWILVRLHTQDTKMSNEITSNLQRQEDEVTALSSIYDETEFFYTKSECIKCSISIHPKFLEKLEVKFTGSCPSDGVVSNDSIFVEHLPPIKMYIHLPNTYPSKMPPNFCLSIIWLTPWEMSFVCQKFDEMWQENQGNEILFLWLSFLQNDIFNFLNIWESLDISFLHLIHTSQDKDMLRLAQLSDPRAQNGALLLDIKQLLISYDKKQHKAQFDKNFYTCYICFEEHIGLNCIELQNCGHIYCVGCMKKHVRIRIIEYNTVILCPTIDCKCTISNNDIKLLCPDLFFQYEEIMLRVTLDTMDDVMYCPRISCQYPVIVNSDDEAPMCPNCNYCFCVYCRKVRLIPIFKRIHTRVHTHTHIDISYIQIIFIYSNSCIMDKHHAKCHRPMFWSSVTSTKTAVIRKKRC